MIKKEYNSDDLNKVEAARLDAEKRATEAKNAAAKAQADAAIAIREKQEAEKKVTIDLNSTPSVLARVTAPFFSTAPPEDDKDALERLTNEIDTLHVETVAKEAALMNGPDTEQRFAGFNPAFPEMRQYRTVPVRKPNPNRYRKYTHRASPPGTSVSFAGGSAWEGPLDGATDDRLCSPCDANFRTLCQMDAIYKCRPELGASSWAFRSPRRRRFRRRRHHGGRKLAPISQADISLLSSLPPPVPYNATPLPVIPTPPPPPVSGGP